ncbi:hypothetical protein J6590_025605 [Homalodisca vitripennis]|nr:hypothetical protein J6590_025605 [Homalodisca vitripennis]
MNGRPVTVHFIHTGGLDPVHGSGGSFMVHDWERPNIVKVAKVSTTVIRTPHNRPYSLLSADPNLKKEHYTEQNDHSHSTVGHTLHTPRPPHVNGSATITVQDTAWRTLGRETSAA